ncbi:hypothetical protein FLAG1_00887 [Fusarium langsethiae]|uniref:Uncharacterized protein n=1 Tax=Fusarium langsethiae TaxID=179993 RepID=A0A0M9F526_FUSLA|nr:hypothetical protein FLAG1_00887 [Fusarium langsethiae]
MVTDLYELSSELFLYKNFHFSKLFFIFTNNTKTINNQSRALSSPSGGSLRRCSSFFPRPAWVEMILVTSKVCDFAQLDSLSTFYDEAALGSEIYHMSTKSHFAAGLENLAH